MLKSSFILLLASIVVSCNNEIQSPAQANIYFPAKLLEQENVFHYSLIKDIKEKETMNYADCIQIAILYTQYDAKQDDVYFWLKKSQELNSPKFCETLKYFEQKESFDLNKKFSEDINNLLAKCTE